MPITLVLEFGDTILLLEETQRRRLGHLPLFVIVECRNPYCRWGHMLMVVLTLMLKLMLMLLYMLAYEFKMPIHKMLIERKHHCVQRFPFKTQFGNKESKLFLRSSTSVALLSQKYVFTVYQFPRFCLKIFLLQDQNTAMRGAWWQPTAGCPHIKKC